MQGGIYLRSQAGGGFIVEEGRMTFRFKVLGTICLSPFPGSLKEQNPPTQPSVEKAALSSRGLLGLSSFRLGIAGVIT